MSVQGANVSNGMQGDVTISSTVDGSGKYIGSSGDLDTPQLQPNQVMVGCKYYYNWDGVKGIYGIYWAPIWDIGQRNWASWADGQKGVSENDMGTTKSIMDYQCAQGNIIVGMWVSWWDNLGHLEFYEAPLGDTSNNKQIQKGMVDISGRTGADNKFVTTPNMALIGFHFGYNPTGTRPGIKKINRAYFRNVNTAYGNVSNIIDTQINCIKAGYPDDNNTSLCPMVKDMNPDQIVSSWCPIHLDDQFCGCFRSAASIPGVPLQIQNLMSSNPKCWDAQCVSQGYQTADLKNAPACVPITYCPMEVNFNPGSVNNLIGNNFKVDCSSYNNQQAANTANKPIVDTSALQAVTDAQNAAAAAAVQQKQTADAAAAAAVEASETEEYVIVLIVILIVVIGICIYYYFKIPDAPSPGVPVDPSVAPPGPSVNSAAPPPIQYPPPISYYPAPPVDSTTPSPIPYSQMPLPSAPSIPQYTVPPGYQLVAI